jgi:hypothetical protein
VLLWCSVIQNAWSISSAPLTRLIDWQMTINPLNAELNPICHLLASFGAHHIVHISRIRVNRPLFAAFLLRTCPNFHDLTRPDSGTSFPILFFGESMTTLWPALSLDYYITDIGLWHLSRYSDLLRTGWSGDCFLVWATFSAPVMTGSGTHPASYIIGTGFLPRG